MNNPSLIVSELLKNSFRFQKIIFYGMGLVAAITGIVILLLMVFIPAQPGEETVIFYLKITAGMFILFGVWCVWYVKRRISLVLGLLISDPSNILYIQPVSVTKNGISGHAIRIYTNDGRMIGLNVSSSQSQKHIIQSLKKAFPSVSFKD